MSEKMADQQTRLAALYEVSAKLGTTLDLAELLNLVMDSIIQLTGAERGTLVLKDEISGEIQPVAARNVDQESIMSKAMQVSRTVVERAIRVGEPILTDNAQEDDRFAGHQSVVGYQLRSIMCAPLWARGRVIGAVYVDNRLFSGVFKQSDLDLLVAFINQAAMAVDNARLFTQTDEALTKRVEELTLFQEFDRELNKSLDLNHVLKLALDWALKLTTADSGSLGLIQKVELEDGKKEKVLKLLVHEGETEASRQEVPIDHPILAKVLELKSPVHSQDVTPEQAIDGTPSAAQLAVPIKREGEITGLIALESAKTKNFSEDDVAFVSRLADRAAVAIENARLYEAIAAAHKAKSDFISVVTHELRLPMTSIKGYTDLVVKEMAGPLNDQQKDFLSVVQRNLQRMSVLVSDLSAINRMESNRMRFEFSDFDIRIIVNDVKTNIQEAVDSKEQTLIVNMPAELPLVYADSNRISQVLTNLVSNANKYTPEKGNIEVNVFLEDKFIRISVVDDGLGISPEDQEKLFTQFFRAEDSEVRKQSGWGLGLSIVKMMVEAQGGEISFESTFREGSTFTFTVPIANP